MAGSAAYRWPGAGIHHGPRSARRFPIHNSVGACLTGIALIIVVGFALIWVCAAIGLAVKDLQTALMTANLSMFVLFSLARAIPVDAMPGWLQPFAQNQPVASPSLRPSAGLNRCLRNLGPLDGSAQAARPGAFGGIALHGTSAGWAVHLAAPMSQRSSAVISVPPGLNTAAPAFARAGSDSR